MRSRALSFSSCAFGSGVDGNGNILAAASGIGGVVLARGFCGPALLNFLYARAIAADAETAKAFKLAVTAENGQSRHFDRQALIGVIERPEQHNSAESFPRRERGCDLTLWIEIEGLGYFSLIVIKHGGSFRSEQIGKFLACESEAVAASVCRNKTKRQYNVTVCLTDRLRVSDF